MLHHALSHVIERSRASFAGKDSFTSINSCLCPVGSVDGASITTVEGIGNSKAGYHAVQGSCEPAISPQWDVTA